MAKSGQINVALPKEWLPQLEQVAKVRGLTVNDVVREAVREHCQCGEGFNLAQVITCHTAMMRQYSRYTAEKI